MNEPADFIALLEGRECRALVAQELWHRGAPADLVSVVFLQVDGGRWACFYFDAGAFVWRQAAPEPVTGAAPAWEFRLVDVGERLGVTGQRVVRVGFTQPDRDCARLTIVLDGGTLILDHADDRSRLAFLSAA